MGKDSLIKSTSKKKPKTKKDSEEKKVKKGKKAPPKTALKTSQKAKTSAKAKSAASKKVSAKKQAAPKAPKSAATPKPPKVTTRELLARKFESWKPDKPFSVQTRDPLKTVTSAPPIISTSDPDEAKRLKSLLLKNYNYKQLVTAAEKAAAEKAAAEKAAAEKAAAEKAAAEKAAAEKAAAEKAAAEKAAAEKAAAEKAAAEKAAAEKAAAEKAAAEPKATIRYQPPTESKPADPAAKMLKYGIAGFILLVCLVIGASALNTGKFYLKATNGATEIWQGKFAPKGAKILISLPGLAYTGPVKDTYSKAEVFPIIFGYYIEKSDTLLDVPGLPDFDGVIAYLNQALTYASNDKLAAIAHSRRNNIDLMVLLYKADVAASKDTVEGLESALKHLKQAAGYDADALQKERITQKTSAASTRLETLKAQSAAAADANAAESETPETAEEEHPVD